MIYKFKQQIQDLSGGFTLIESMAAMVIMGVILAYSMPIYMFTRIKIETSQRRLEALVLTQRIITNLEQSRISDLPTDGSATVVDPSSTSAVSSSPPTVTSLLKVGSRTYDATIDYCFPITGGSGCRADYRELKINITHKGNFVYGQQVAISEK